MRKNIIPVLLILLMAAAIIAADVMFFKHRFWQRLIANIGIVLVFLAIYLIFLKR